MVIPERPTSIDAHVDPPEMLMCRDELLAAWCSAGSTLSGYCSCGARAYGMIAEDSFDGWHHLVVRLIHEPDCQAQAERMLIGLERTF